MSLLLQPLRKIAIVRLVGLGDLLCAVPALRALRAAATQAEIMLVGLPTARWMGDRFRHYLDGVLEFPGYPGLPEQTPDLKTLPKFLEQHQQAFDVAIQMHGSGVLTNPLTVLLGAKQSAGFYLPGHYCPDPDLFLPYVERESEVRRYLRLFEHLGIPSQGEALEFPLTEQDHRDFQTTIAGVELQVGQYVCVHPGASVGDRRWSVEGFARVADALAEQGFQVVLTGSVAEVNLTQAVAAMMTAPVLNLAGCTTLGSLAVLLQGARLLVCNDTGVSHLAAALQISSVVLFTGSDPVRWAPLDRDRHRTVEATTSNTVEAVVIHAQALLRSPLVLRSSVSNASAGALASIH